MMKIAKKAERALDRKKETEQKNRDTVLLILSVGFLVGGVLGCLLEDIWPDYPSKDDFFFNEEEY